MRSTEHSSHSAHSLRPAWVEIDVDQWRRNWTLIRQDTGPALAIVSVVKDDAYGHGMLAAARLALEFGALMFAVPTLAEAIALRDAGIAVPILLLGPRHDREAELCVGYGLTCTITEFADIKPLAEASTRLGRRLDVHIKVNTGMNRFGVRPENISELALAVRSSPSLNLCGVFSHFSQSDELDKTFAHQQTDSFKLALDAIATRGPVPLLRHLCNSGGYLDLRAAHFDAVRLGILPLGVYPSQVCRRIPGIKPVMSVKARIASLHDLHPGDRVGYGMHFTATERCRIAILPIGYGDGFPRVRNEGHVLIRGKRAPIIGGVSMDALFVNVSNISDVRRWDVATLLGSDGDEQITAHDVARLKRSVSYDVLCSWRSRLPRVISGESDHALT